MSKNTNTNISAAEKQALRLERYAIELDKLFADKSIPEEVAARCANPGALALLTFSRSLTTGNPFEPFLGEGEITIPSGISRMASAMAQRMGRTVVNEANPAFTGWALPSRALTVEDVLPLLEEHGAAFEADGVIRLHGVTLNSKKLEIVGKPVRAGLVMAPDHTLMFEFSPEEMWSWVVLGALQGMREGNAAKQFTGFIRVLYSQVAEKAEYGYSDGAHQSFLASKRPIFEMGWSWCGYTLRKLDGRNSAAFGKVITKLRGKSAHGQGKYILDAKSEVLGMKFVVDTNGDGRYYMSSAAAAKWFKRHTLGRCLQVRPVSPDVSLFRNTNSGTHEGRKVKTLLLEVGSNDAGLGMVVSMLSRPEMAKFLNVVDDEVHTADWVGVHAPVLPKLGDKVAKGQVLVAGPDPVVARCYGVVVHADILVNDGKTYVQVAIANPDKTGQAKLRSEMLKGSVGYLRWLNPDWAKVCKDHGWTLHQTAGDIAILHGLNPGEYPHFTASEDAAKLWGKGNRQGWISAIANTLGVTIVYDPEVDAAGGYDALIKRFKAIAKRESLIYARAVLNEVADEIKAAGRPDVRSISRCGAYSIVQYETTGWLVDDVVKVEALSVRNSETEGYVPLEVAAFAGKLIGPYTAAMITGNGEQFEDLVALHSTARPVFNPALEAQYSLNEMMAGRTPQPYLAKLAGWTLLGQPILGNIPLVDITALQPDQIGSLQNRAAKPLELPGTVCYLDSKDGVAVVVSPKVLKAFGMADSESSLVSLFSQLCYNAGHGNVDLAKQALRQLKGAIAKIAVSAKVNQRAFRGTRTIQAKTAAGAVPQGWVAIGYRSSVARRLAKHFGFDKLSKDELRARGWMSPVDGLWGEVTLVYRAPQAAPLPLRIYMPDAPQMVLDSAEVQALLPEGDVFRRTIPRLEPNRFFMSVFDTAFDNGDHDGDGRNLIAVTCPFAKAECLAFLTRAEAYRKSVLSTYMGVAKDPVSESLKYDDSKRSWAKVVEMTEQTFNELSLGSIENQTSQIGFAYNMAHMALMAFADLAMSDAEKEGNLLVAHSFFVGHYEEQLAGYDPVYYNLYRLLLDDSEYWTDGKFNYVAYFHEVNKLNASVHRDAQGLLTLNNPHAENLNHNEHDTMRLMRLRNMVQAHKKVSAGKISKVSLKGPDLTRAIIGGLVREMSKGVFTDEGKLSGLFSQAKKLTAMDLGNCTLMDSLRFAPDSVGCWALTRFFERVYPLIECYGSDDSEYGLSD